MFDPESGDVVIGQAADGDESGESVFEMFGGVFRLGLDDETGMEAFLLFRDRHFDGLYHPDDF